MYLVIHKNELNLLQDGTKIEIPGLDCLISYISRDLAFTIDVKKLEKSKFPIFDLLFQYKSYLLNLSILLVHFAENWRIQHFAHIYPKSIQNDEQARIFLDQVCLYKPKLYPVSVLATCKHFLRVSPKVNTALLAFRDILRILVVRPDLAKVITKEYNASFTPKLAMDNEYFRPKNECVEIYKAEDVHVRDQINVVNKGGKLAPVFKWLKFNERKLPFAYLLSYALHQVNAPASEVPTSTPERVYFASELPQLQSSQLFLDIDFQNTLSLYLITVNTLHESLAKEREIHCSSASNQEERFNTITYVWKNVDDSSNPVEGNLPQTPDEWYGDYSSSAASPRFNG